MPANDATSGRLAGAGMMRCTFDREQAACYLELLLGGGPEGLIETRLIEMSPAERLAFAERLERGLRREGKD